MLIIFFIIYLKNLLFRILDSKRSVDFIDLKKKKFCLNNYHTRHFAPISKCNTLSERILDLVAALGWSFFEFRSC